MKQKPENIGFDANDTVKLFDFGLARELHDDDKVDGNLWKLSGFTGTTRYMAPEIYKCQPYNLTADVYSFSLVLWEMLELERPYSDSKFIRNLESFRHSVIEEGKRPKCNLQWPVALSDLMKSSWDADIRKRPDSAQVKSVLNRELAFCRKLNQSQSDVTSTFRGETRTTPIAGRMYVGLSKQMGCLSQTFSISPKKEKKRLALS